MEKSIEIYLSNGSEIIKLPILPSEFKIQTGQNLEEVNIHELGNIELIGKRKADSISISSFFPGQEYPFMHSYFIEPYELCSQIRSWEENGDVIDFQITGAGYSKSMIIESFSYGQSDGTGDVSYSINLKEYRNISSSRVSKNLVQTVHVCKKGDTFYSIARMYTGNSANAEYIARINGMKVSAKLKKGKRITVAYEG